MSDTMAALELLRRQFPEAAQVSSPAMLGSPVQFASSQICPN